MSLGLIYPPSAFCKREELVELAKVLKKYDALLTVHMRNEGPRIFQAVDEMLDITRRSGVHLQISHLKLMGLSLIHILYWKKATSAACWASFLFSTVVMLSNIFVGSRFPALLQSPINAGAFCMLAGLVIVPVVSLFTRKPDPVLVEDAFSCYNKPVIVAQRAALGD